MSFDDCIDGIGGEPVGYRIRCKYAVLQSADTAVDRPRPNRSVVCAQYRINTVLSQSIIMRIGACCEFVGFLGQDCETSALPPNAYLIAASADGIHDILVQSRQRDGSDLRSLEPIQTSR